MCHFGLQSTHVASSVRKKDGKKYVTTRVVSTWDILTRRNRFFSVEQIWQQREKRGRKSDTSWNNNCILKKVWPLWFCKKVWFSFHVNGKLHKNWSLNYRGILVGLVDWILYWPALIWRFFWRKKIELADRWWEFAFSEAIKFSRQITMFFSSVDLFLEGSQLNFSYPKKNCQLIAVRYYNPLAWNTREN